MVTMLVPFGSKAGQALSSVVPSTMFTPRISSLIPTEPLSSQSPMHGPPGVEVGGTGVTVGVGVAGVAGRLTRPILEAVLSVNQILPSGPAMIRFGPLSLVGGLNSVITPAGVIFPIVEAAVNHTLPRGRR